MPHPTAYLRAMVTTRQAVDSWYMYFFQLPRLPERTLSRRGGRGERWLTDGGMTPAERDRFHSEIVAHGALRGGLGWYRAMAMLDRSQLGRKVTAPTTMVWSDGDAFIARTGIDGCARYVDAPYEPGRARGRRPLDPHPRPAGPPPRRSWPGSAVSSAGAA